MLLPLSGKETIDAFPVASKNALHPQNLKKETMRKRKTVSKKHLYAILCVYCYIKVVLVVAVLTHFLHWFNTSVGGKPDRHATEPTMNIVKFTLNTIIRQCEQHAYTTEYEYNCHIR